MTDAQIYTVGGIVRDKLLGKPSKDVDLSVVLVEDDPRIKAQLAADIGFAFETMRAIITSQGFEIFDMTPDKLTVRAGCPRDHPLAQFGSRTADFVLARRDGPYSDGRRPDWVTVGTLHDDLARRDFTVNAMAQFVGVIEDGEFRPVAPGDVIDHFGGITDLEAMRLRFVGDPRDRIREDALRVMRALRFSITKGFTIADETLEAIVELTTAELLAEISQDRRVNELVPMFRHDTIASMRLLTSLPLITQMAIFDGDVRLEATLKQ